MRIFFSVGEPSGDLHGANLIRAAAAIDAELATAETQVVSASSAFLR